MEVHHDVIGRYLLINGDTLSLGSNTTVRLNVP